MKKTTFAQDDDNKIPSDAVISRRQLLETYQQRVSELAVEQEAVIQQLESYARCTEDEHKLGWETRQRSDEMEQMLRALNDMQSYLLKEREQVLRLHSNNDKLKLRAHEDTRKIGHLVQLCGLAPEEARHFANPARGAPPPITVRREGGGPSIRKAVSRFELDAHQRQAEALRLQVQSLEAQITEQAKLTTEHKKALEEDARIRKEELHALRSRNGAKIRLLKEKFKGTQEMMYKQTQEFLDKRQHFREHEKEWMEEKAHLLKDVSIILSHKPRKEPAGERPKSPALLPSWNSVTGEAIRRTEEDYRQAVRDLQWQVDQQEKLTDLYREQMVQMETDIERFRSDSDSSKTAYHQRQDRMANRLNIINRRYQELERRRALEVEGFQNDLRNLRQKLRKLESQLYKITMNLGDPLSGVRPGDEVELAILEHVRGTAAESKRLSSDMRLLKEMMAGLEGEVKDL